MLTPLKADLVTADVTIDGVGDCVEEVAPGVEVAGEAMVGVEVVCRTWGEGEVQQLRGHRLEVCDRLRQAVQAIRNFGSAMTTCVNNTSPDRPVTLLHDPAESRAISSNALRPLQGRFGALLTLGGFVGRTIPSCCKGVPASTNHPFDLRMALRGGRDSERGLLRPNLGYRFYLVLVAVLRHYLTLWAQRTS
ncbi:hypothetical protein MRB53_038476 [Persea americana]|nr:hypothetical protein MRB53_038476 [Persea americana]